MSLRLPKFLSRSCFVIIIFLVYAFSTSKNLVMLMYVFDNILYNFDVAIRIYFQKVASPADIASSMSVGFTINHIAAVFLPALGGFFWMIDYRIPCKSLCFTSP